MHFQSKLHNNSILTGSVDSFCLVCDNYLRSEDEAFMHTEKTIHKKNMMAAKIVEKFLDDRIIKVKNGYYCPFCNILLSTTTKVTIHIGDTNHQEKKGAQMLSRIGNSIMAFGEVAITMESWHGLIDDTCVICSTEFDEKDKHCTDHSHILKLVQSKCEFGDKYLYRKVDEDSFFCLICGSVFSINEKPNHHESISHKTHYKTGRELKNKIPPQTKNTTQMALPKPEPIITPNEECKPPVAAKHTEGKIKNAEAKIKSTPSPDRGPIVLGDGKLTVALSTVKETATSFEKTVLSKNIAEKNQEKPENGATANDKSEKVVNKTFEKEKVSNVLDRLDEFQEAGINIDFTWERARCMHCNMNIHFNVPAIQGHIDKHKIGKVLDKTEPKLDLKKEAKMSDHVAKADTKKTDREITPKLDAKKQVKKSDKTKEVKTDSKKTDSGVKPKADSIKTETEVAPNTEIHKSSNGLEPKTVTKTIALPMEPEIDTKRKGNRMEPKTDAKKNDSNMEPTPKKQKKSESDLNADTFKELETFAKENNLVITGNEVYCPICKVKFTLNLAAMKEHTNLNSHKDKTPRQNGEPRRNGEPRQNGESQMRVVTAQYIKSFMRLESTLGSEVCLNDKYILRQNSFHCVVIDRGIYKCTLCPADFRKSRQFLTQHMTSSEHRNKLSYCKVVVSLSEEFIRETTPDMYHCGYCNDVFNGWTVLLNHLSHSKHMQARRHAEWVLERCQNLIRTARPMQVSSMQSVDYA